MVRLLLLCGLLLCPLSGCGGQASDMPKLGTVRGTVTLDGQPVVGVTVYFKPEVGRPSMGRTDDKGYYRAMYLIDTEGVKVGPNKVHLEWGVDESGPAIPDQYGLKSDMTLDVKPGKNEFNITMTSAAAGK